ncbi:hypothetical protein BH18CHL1_BH18CHL1_08990 [soil metagenome]
MTGEERPIHELDEGVRIAWTADGFESIQVVAPWRPAEDLAAFARAVADAALIERTLAALSIALRRDHPGAFELVPVRHDKRGAKVIVRLLPPPGEPNPDE